MDHNNLNLSEKTIEDIEKKIKTKRRFFKKINIIIIFCITSFVIFTSISLTLMLFSNELIWGHINNQYFLNNLESGSNVIKYFTLWTNMNDVSLKISNTSLAFCLLLFISLILQTVRNKFDKRKKNIWYSTINSIFICYVFCLIPITFVFTNFSYIPIGIDTTKMEFFYNQNFFHLKNIALLTFKIGTYDILLDPNFQKELVSKGNLSNIWLILFIINVVVFILMFIFYIMQFPNIIRKEKNIINIDLIGDAKGIKLSNSNVTKINSYDVEKNDNKIDYFEKQYLFFEENKNRNKKMPTNISITEDIDFSINKNNKKLLLKETDDKDQIVPNPNIKGLSKLKDKRKIDDLFLKEI